MICPHCKQETEPEPEHVANWLPVWINGVEYTAVDWGSIKAHRFYTNTKKEYGLAIPLLFVLACGKQGKD